MTRGEDCCLASNGGVCDIDWYPWHLWFSCRIDRLRLIEKPFCCVHCTDWRDHTRPLPAVWEASASQPASRLGNSQPSNYPWLDKSTINLDGASFLEPKSGAWLGPLLDQNLSLVLRWRKVRVVTRITRRYSARLGPGRLAMFHRETAESPTSRMRSRCKQGLGIFEQDSRPSGMTAWCTKLQ